jgi:hypothetical protein
MRSLCTHRATSFPQKKATKWKDKRANLHNIIFVFVCPRTWTTAFNFFETFFAAIRRQFWLILLPACWLEHPKQLHSHDAFQQRVVVHVHSMRPTSQCCRRYSNHTVLSPKRKCDKKSFFLLSAKIFFMGTCRRYWIIKFMFHIITSDKTWG